ncbi:MAG: ABC transporter substrate-binding protein [Prochloraceae cyanobacterium]|nr:ABC transporter substrate-binding protein [Prochloraceae cyanobacterium]
MEYRPRKRDRPLVGKFSTHISIAAMLSNFFRGFSINSRCLSLIVTLSCALTLPGCSLSQLRAQPSSKSQLVLAIPNNPDTFNYGMVRSPYNVILYIYTGLLEQNRFTLELEPALAESWSVSPDKRRITFTLRENLKWSDGEPLTVDDVIFTYRDIYLNKKIPTIFRKNLIVDTKGSLPSVKKLDSRTVEFTSPEPFSPLLIYVARLPILPAHALRSSTSTTDANGNLKFLSTWTTETNPKKIISNGPYRLVSYTPSERVVLEKNPYYWRKDDLGKQMPYIDKVVVQIISSNDNQLLRFRSGELDSIRVPVEAFELLKRQEKQGNYTLHNRGTTAGIWFLGFNLNRGSNSQGKAFVNPIKSRWFNTLAFRQAIAYAIDRESMKNNIYRGLGELQYSPLSDRSVYYLSPEAGLKVYNYNPQKAKQLLLKAGFNYNSKGELLDWDGNRVEFNVLVKSEEKSRIDMAVAVQQDLSKIGIKTNLQVLSFNTVLVKLLRSRDWDSYVGSFDGGALEPHDIFGFWSYKGSFHLFNQGKQGKEKEIAGWEVSEWEQKIDKLFLSGAQKFTDRDRQNFYREFQQIVVEQVPVIFLVNPLKVEAVRNRVGNVKFSAVGLGLFSSMEELKIKDKQAINKKGEGN